MGGVLDQEFAKFLISQLGVGGAISALVLYFYRKDSKERAALVLQIAELWKSMGEREDRRTDALIVLVRDNTSATVQNTEVLRALHNRIDKLELLRIVSTGEESQAELLERPRPRLETDRPRGSR